MASSRGGKVMMHPMIENYPPFPGGVTGTELMIKWVKQASDELGEGPRMETVTSVELAGQIKTITTDSEPYQCRAVIVASGSSPRTLGVEGEDTLEGKGVFSCAMCDAPLLRTLDRSRALVVGGGDSAVQTALGLVPHAEEITLVTRGPKLAAQSGLVERFMANDNAKCLLGQKVTAINGESWVKAVTLEDSQSHETRTQEMDAVFVGIGQSANTEFLAGALELDHEGAIKVEADLSAGIAGVFAAGDVRVSPLRQILNAAADGALAVKSASEYLAR